MDIENQDIKMLYEECLQYKIRIELCYKVLKEKYLEFRQDAYQNVTNTANELKEELEEKYDSFTSEEKIELMFSNYKELLVKFLLYKKKMAFLIENSKSIIGEEGMKKMVDDQNTILKFIVDINNQMPDTKIQEIQSLINSNN